MNESIEGKIFGHHPSSIHTAWKLSRCPKEEKLTLSKKEHNGFGDLSGRFKVDVGKVEDAGKDAPHALLVILRKAQSLHRVSHWQAWKILSDHEISQRACAGNTFAKVGGIVD